MNKIDIQAKDFSEHFRISDGTVGQVGHGFIGDAVARLFGPHCRVLIYDKFKTGVEYSSLDDLVRECEVIFVAVPTPMSPSGECHTGILESALQDIQNRAASVGRDLGAFVVVIKSTVPPGFTNRMQDRFAMRIVLSPEFLTEAHAAEDFRTTNRVILGGDYEDAAVVFKYFEGVWPDRMRHTWVDHKDGIVDIIQCDPTVAEMVKLSANAHLAARVVLSNEIYLICERLGIPYDDVKRLSQLDPRIGLSHMDVPGSDGKRGFSGSCFPKDINNLASISRKLGLGENNIFRAVSARNVEFRPEKDWEQLKGRAVVDE